MEDILNENALLRATLEAIEQIAKRSLELNQADYTRCSVIWISKQVLSTNNIYRL